MRVAICEDEKVYRDMLKQKVEAYFWGRYGYGEGISNDIVSSGANASQKGGDTVRVKNITHSREIILTDAFSDGTDLLEAMGRGECYDLIFMDLQMEKSDGMEISAQIRKLDEAVKIIFVTGIGNRAAEGYRVSAFDYIVKNELDTALIPALDRFVKESEQENLAIVTNDGETVILRIRDILWVESEKRGTKFTVYDSCNSAKAGTRKTGHGNNLTGKYGKTAKTGDVWQAADQTGSDTNAETAEYHAPMPIGKVASLLDAAEFIEIFKSVYVRISQIRRIGEDKIVMSEGSELPLSRRKRKTVMSEVLKNVRNKA